MRHLQSIESNVVVANKLVRAQRTDAWHRLPEALLQPLPFAVGKTVSSNHIENAWLSWWDFTQRLTKPKRRGAETLANFLSLSTDHQSRLKDVGYYVPGHFADGQRKAGNLATRQCLTLDIDHAPPDIVELLRNGPDGLGGLPNCAWLLHSTRKHSAEKPRLRLVVLLARPVDVFEHEAVGRWVAGTIPTRVGDSSIDWFDRTTFQFSRPMYWPSVCADSAYIFEQNLAAPLDPDWVLKQFGDWRDKTAWPRAAGDVAPHDACGKPERPGEKSGIVGAFCRAYDIRDAIATFLPDAYCEGSAPDRLTYSKGSTGNGAVLYDSGQFIFSHHETDPAQGRLCNAWDLVRLHKYGELDAGVSADTPPAQRPSEAAMRRMAGNDRLTLQEMLEDARQEAGDDGEGNAVPTVADNVESARVGLTDFRAYLPAGTFVFTPTMEHWNAASVDKRLGRLRGSLESPEAPESDAGSEAPSKRRKRGRPPARNLRPSEWLARNRAVEQQVWAPGEPAIIEGRLLVDGGWLTKPDTQCLNLYRPPKPPVGEARAADPWRDHVARIYGSDARHIECWLAHRVQRPAEKINHALVLGGNQGVGKDTLLEPVKRAIGPWNFKEVSPAQMLGRFNGFVKSVILRVSEARDLGDTNRYSFYEHTKTYIASPPDVLTCDEKHIREHAVLNVCGVTITSNHKVDGFYLPPDDRRHFVAWSELTKEDFPPGYWDKLWNWYTSSGGYGHVAAYLASLDLSDFDAKAPPPKTAAFRAIVDSNRAPEDAEMADALDAVGRPAAVTVGMLISNAAITGELRRFFEDRRNSRQIPHRFETAGYLRVSNGGSGDGYWRIGTKRQAVYARVELNESQRQMAASELVKHGAKSGAEDFDGL